ncbi:MAG TPA: TraB/GumN family protein [Cyclobacteriaceae bacterium]|nr:TraB/GumN family protein [Cyclobacteriaceae bacterium]
MKKIILSLLVLAFIQTKAQHSLIWEISGNGLTKKSYLMGTLKFIGEKEFYMPPKAAELIKQSEIFAIEDEVDHHAQHELNTALHFPKGQTLADVIPADDYKKVKALFEKEFKINSATFDKKYAHIKPLPLSIIMTRLSLGEKVRFYDIELLLIAKKHDVTAYSLEPIEREAEALNSFSMEDQVQALMHSVNNFTEQRQEFKKLMSDYRTADLQEIFDYTLHPLENNPRFIEEFYFKRNAEWLPKIEKMMAEDASFIALGISHLEGEKGILKLLEQKGYTLTALK